jgi:hypothetical protein
MDMIILEQKVLTYKMHTSLLLVFQATFTLINEKEEKNKIKIILTYFVALLLK